MAGPAPGGGRGSDAPIDEETAWALLRAALAGAERGEVGRRIHLDGSPGVWLDLGPHGEWTSSSPPTEAARELLDLFVPIVAPADLVIAQLGQSLDGRIATEGGDSCYVTGPADIRRLHRLRALVDAVVVGAGTVALDDPRLTVREVEGENPVRVVLDPSGRLDPVRRVFSDGAAHTLLLRRAETRPMHSGSGESRSPEPERGPGAPEVVHLPADAQGFDPAEVLSLLRARNLGRVLVEGGGVTVSRFLQAGLLDRLHLTVAPLLIGSGRPSLTLPPIASLGEALRPRCRHFRLGDDLLFDLDLR